MAKTKGVFTDTDYSNIAVGTTAQRPSSPITGQERFNTDSGMVETYNGSSWVSAPVKNHIINGNFNFWQRGTSAASGSGVYLADRWYSFSVTGRTISRQAAASVNSTYGLKAQRDNGNTATSGLWVAQPFETANIVPIRGKYLTVSFWAKAGANFSPTGSLLNVTIVTGTGAEGKHVGGGFSGATSLLSSSVTLTTTITKYTLTTNVVVPNTATQMELYFSVTPVGTAGADDSFTLEQVMLNEGLNAAPFQLAGGDLQGELAKCQRYFEKSYDVNTAPGTVAAFGCMRISGTGLANRPVYQNQYKATKRTASTVVTMYSTATGAGGTLSNGKVRNESTNADITVADLTAGGENGSNFYNIGTTPSNGDQMAWHFTVDAEI